MTHEPEMLSADRHRLLKEHLMSEIARESVAKEPKPRRLGWLVVPPLVVGLAAAVAVVAPGSRPSVSVAPGAPSPVHSAVPTPTGAPTPVPTPTGHPAHPSPSLPPCATVAEHLANPSGSKVSGDPVQALAAAAEVAASKPAPVVKDSQFIYTESLQLSDTGEPCVRQEWIAADGKSEGLIIDPHSGEIGFTPNAGGLPTSLAVPNYRYLASLPTDPQKLLQKIYAEGNLKGNEPNGAAFRTIENLLMYQLVPPAVGGAFCQAAAAVPGATVQPDAVDTAGRHGIGVTKSDGTSQMELIFDPNTCALLGHRDVTLVDNSAHGGSPAGAVYSSAILRQGVTDQVREQPNG